MTEQGTSKKIVAVGAVGADRTKKDKAYLCAYEYDTTATDETTVPSLSRYAYLTESALIIKLLKDNGGLKTSDKVAAASTAAILAGTMCLFFEPCGVIVGVGIVIAGGVGAVSILPTILDKEYKFNENQAKLEDAYRFAFSKQNTTISASAYADYRLLFTAASNAKDLVCPDVKIKDLRN